MYIVCTQDIRQVISRLHCHATMAEFILETNYSSTMNNYLRWIIICLRRIKSSTYKSRAQTKYCGPKFVLSDSTSVRTAGRWIKWRRTCESTVKTNFGSKFTSFISMSTRHARRQIKWRKIWGQNSSKHWIYIYCSRFICLRRIIRLRLIIHLLYKFGQYLVDCSQSPNFSWDRLYIPHFTVTAVLFFKCTEGVGVGDYILGGGGGRKIEGL